MNEIKKAAYNFYKKYNIKNINAEMLEEIIKKQGYTVVEYNAISNNANVESLLSALGLVEVSRVARAFTYADNNMRIVFISDGVSEEEKLVLLAHEQGHIFLGHMTAKNGIYGEDIICEHSANTFAHYILEKNFLRSFKLFFSNHKVKLIMSFIALVLIIIFIIGINVKLKHTNRFCITPAGEKYHIEYCPTVYASKRIYGTIEQFEKIGRQPCSICIH